MTSEELMQLKVGDRIIATGKTCFNTKAGDKGTVVYVSETDATIKWDNDVNGWEDDYYDIEDGHGEYIGKVMCNRIELLNPLHNHKIDYYL